MKKTSWVTWISGGIVLLFWILSLSAPLVADASKSKGVFPIVKYGPESIDLFNSKVLGAPDREHIFGADHVGRDVFARLIHAIKNSFFFSLAVVIFSLVIGTILGGLMGFFGGKFDI